MVELEEEMEGQAEEVMGQEEAVEEQEEETVVVEEAPVQVVIYPPVWMPVFQFRS